MVKIKELRKKNNLTQMQLAKLLGITQKTVSAYEARGITPSAEVFYKMSKVFNIPLEELFKNCFNYTPEPPTSSDEEGKRNARRQEK